MLGGFKKIMAQKEKQTVSLKGVKAVTVQKEKQAVSLKGVKIITVTGANRIAAIAAERGINAQEVFVRVTFEYEGKQYSSSNKLRFFGKENYEKLLKVRDDESLVNITVTKNEQGTLMYLDPDKDVSVKELFDTPVEVKDTRKNLEDLF